MHSNKIVLSFEKAARKPTFEQTIKKFEDERKMQKSFPPIVPGHVYDFKTKTYIDIT